MDSLQALALQWLAMAPAPPPGTESTAPAWTHFMPMFLLLILMYFLILRPNQIRVREHEKVVQTLEPGDQVITTGGLCGTVAPRKGGSGSGDKEKDKEKAEFLMIKIADNVTVKVLTSAIQTVRKSDGKTSTSL